MKIVMRDQFAYIEKAHSVPAVIKNMMTYTTIGKNGERIVKNVFDQEENKFPAGAWPSARTALNNTGMYFEFQDETKYPSPKNKLETGLQLRSYQLESKKAFLEGVNDQNIRCRGIISIATGGGKTIVAEELIGDLNTNTLFFVHTKDLLTQTFESLKSVFGPEKVGRAGGDHKTDFYDSSGEIKQIVVCMVQSFYAQGKNSFSILPEYKVLLDRCQFIILDECHHSSSDSWFYVAMECRAPFRLGLSATPFRADGTTLLLEAATGPIIYKISSSELIELGYLSRPTINIFPVDTNIEDEFQDTTWQNLYKAAIVFNDHRNSIIASIAAKRVAEDNSVMIIVGQKIHGILLMQMINVFIKHLKDSGDIDPNDQSKTAVAINSGYESESRDMAMRMFKEGKLKCLIVTQLGDEGIDIPSVNTVIMAAALKSEIKVIQRLGRALRLGTRCNHMNPDKSCSLFSTEGCSVKCYELEKRINHFSSKEEILKESIRKTPRVINQYLGNLEEIGKDKYLKTGQKITKDVTPEQIINIWEYANSDGIMVDPTINSITDIPQRIIKLYKECESRLSFRIITEKEVNLFRLLALLIAIDETVSVKCEHKTLKTKVEYVDFFDLCHIVTEAHSWERLTVYQDEGHNPKEGLLENIADPDESNHIIWKTEGMEITVQDMISRWGSYFTFDNVQIIEAVTNY